jgi:hypothetical protein
MSERPDDRGGQEYPLSDSFRLTEAFLRRYPRYRQTLSLTPEHFRFDPVLWNSGVAALRGLLRSVSDEEALQADEAAIEGAVHNLIEGIVARSAAWETRPPGAAEEG